MTSNLAPERAGTFAWAAIALACGAQLLIGYLTIALSSQVNPWRDPVSDYVFHHTSEPLFVLAVVMLLIGGVAMLAAAHRVGLPMNTATSILFGLWVAGLLLVVSFEGNSSSTQITVHGEIHRFGGAVLYTCLPLACHQLARSLRDHQRWASAAVRIHWCAIAGLLTAAAFGVSQLVPSLPQGLLERIALSTELLLLVALALTIRSSARWSS